MINNSDNKRWDKTKLSQIIHIVGGGTPKTEVKDYWNGNIHWISIRDLKPGRKYIDITEKCITERGLNESSAKMLEKGDIVISARGTVGSLGVLSIPMSFNQSCYGIKADPLFSTNDYVFYLLKHKLSDLLQVSYGGIFDTITRNTFEGISVDLPPLKEQKAIANVLNSLDDKIDLLHRQNTTLEDLSKVLFRKLFTDTPNDSWGLVKIKDVLKIEIGGTPDTSNEDYWNGNIPWINSGEVNNFRITNGIKFITELGLKQSSTKLFPKGTTVIAITGATLGKVSLLEIDTCTNQSVVGIIPNEQYSKEFIFLWINHIIGKIISSQTGVAQSHINKSDIGQNYIIVPDKDYLERGMKSISIMFDKITNNVFQIQALERLRDLLLPKLINGEVRVKF
ncbi:restriction endonuclease subunit S [Ichthyobacterium seriolicida]|uniref:Type I restriction-modification system, specificity subunit S n=1 Tax=Ichthyobacterium seriolicida TaxID=242600 RepID=A0A1J1DVY7_9FLAO|nr:restriction endonuclease subunit S [Ichthyobacterium seriolicida]BAV94025.1 type I restriction-modification system, specificity subunit S [Ichthyobacterium seriolicida]